jgi:peptidoglycan/LPS O-acetylase OafA/YrhL
MYDFVLGHLLPALTMPNHSVLPKKHFSLRRVVANGRYIPEIDGLRFIAIASVLLFHVQQMYFLFPLPPIKPMGLLPNAAYTMIKHGDRGVLLFFAISGMVLGLPFARYHLRGDRTVSWKAYLLRRVTRLEPPYIMNLLLRFPLVLKVKHMALAAGLTHLGVSLFYADWLVYGNMPAIHPPSWSLAVEVQFYLLAPILAWLLFRRLHVVRWAITLIVVCVAATASAHAPGEALHGMLHLSLLLFFQYFLVGLLMADLYVTVMDRWPSGWAWDLAGLAAVWLAFSLPKEITFYALPALLLILMCAALKSHLLRRFLSLTAVSTIGGMCYSIYLTHSLTLQASDAAIMWAAARLGVQFSFWKFYGAGLMFAVPMILLVGTIFFVLIERPCMDPRWPWKLRDWVRARSGSAA